MLLRFATALAPAALAAAQPAHVADPSPVKVRLVASRSHAAPGGSAEVAVHFLVAKGWHIYWKNPGEGGLPTRIELEVPAGFRAERVRYPAPVSIRGPEAATSYGYAGETALFATVRVPAGARRGPVQVAARAQWLACKDICIPGEATLSLDLQVRGGRASPRNVALLAAHRARLPTPLGRLPGARVAWEPGTGDATLEVTVPRRARLELFPGEGALLRGQVGGASGAGTTLRARFAPEGDAFPRTGTLEAVLRVEEKAKIRFYELETPWPHDGREGVQR